MFSRSINSIIAKQSLQTQCAVCSRRQAMQKAVAIATRQQRPQTRSYVTQQQPRAYNRFKEEVEKPVATQIAVEEHVAEEDELQAKEVIDLPFEDEDVSVPRELDISQVLVSNSPVIYDGDGKHVQTLGYISATTFVNMPFEEMSALKINKQMLGFMPSIWGKIKSGAEKLLRSITRRNNTVPVPQPSAKSELTIRDKEHEVKLLTHNDQSFKIYLADSIEKNKYANDILLKRKAIEQFRMCANKDKLEDKHRLMILNMQTETKYIVQGSYLITNEVTSTGTVIIVEISSAQQKQQAATKTKAKTSKASSSKTGKQASAKAKAAPHPQPVYASHVAHGAVADSHPYSNEKSELRQPQSSLIAVQNNKLRRVSNKKGQSGFLWIEL